MGETCAGPDGRAFGGSDFRGAAVGAAQLDAEHEVVLFLHALVEGAPLGALTKKRDLLSGV